MRRGKYGITKRVISMLLSMVLVLAMIPVTGAQAASTVKEGIVKVEADPYTLHAWHTAFDPINLTTEHAGGIWTDKSVLTKDQIAQALPGVSGLTVGDNNFLVALSALAANSVIVGHGQTATDTVFVLDISGSMSTASLNAMVEATNDAIHTLLNAHPEARVGVILYSTNASVLLPLSRYTPVIKTDRTGESVEYIELTSSYIRTARIEEQVKVEDDDDNYPGGGFFPGGSIFPGGGYYPGGDQYETVIKEILKDADGKDFDNSVSLRGGTYIQGGLHAANQMFQNATVKNGTTPVLVLMSDGAPTYVTGSFTNATSGNRTGDGNSSEDGEAFLSQLTGAYVKAKMAEKYGSAAYVYTLGLGVSGGGNTVSVAEAMLDTSKTRSGLEALWRQYLALATASEKTMNVDLAGSRTDAKVTYNAAVTAENRKFVDKYFPASDASQLSTAFKNIVNEISLKGGYNVTRLNSDGTNASGFISFVDEIGSGMEIKGIKGVLIGDTLFTGAKMAQALIEGAYGTETEPTPLGNNMVWSIKQRFGISETSVVHDLIRQAYNAGQIYYNAETGAFSNYIGWFSDAKGDYIGFWDYSDPNCFIPAGAVYANVSYAMLGVTTGSQTAHASDMMYININVSKKITTVNGAAVIAENTPEMVTFSIPASLIPTVTYQIDAEAESNDKIDENTKVSITYIPAEPIRLLYEVGIHDAVTPENIESFLRAGYQAKDADGNYYLYSNAWYWEPSDGTAADFNNPPTKDNAVGKDVLYDTAKNHITYAYFEPGEQNEHYYYVEDTVLYTKKGNTYTPVTGVLDTTGNTQYYYRHRTFASKTAVSATNTQADAMVDIHYGAIDQKVLSDSANYAQNADGQWYIKAGTMRYSIHSHDKDKTENTTGSFFARLHQLVNIKDAATDAYHAEVVYHGNNGRITYAPAQGFKLAKAMASGATAEGSFTFEISVAGDSDGKLRVDGVEQILVSGKTTVSLLAGQTVLVTGIDVGAVYTITELDREGYQLGGIVSESTTAAIQGATIRDTVAENKTPTVTYTNDNRYYGSLLISKSVSYDKKVDGAADTTTFTIDIALPGMEGKQIFANGTPVTLDANGVYTVALKNGQNVLLTGIYEGTAYTVAERTQLPKGYSVVAGSFSGTILRDQTALAAIQNAYSPDDVVIKAAEPIVTIEIDKYFYLYNGTNGNLTDGKRTFTFRLQRYDAAANEWVTVEIDGKAVENTTTFTNPNTNEDPTLGTNINEGIALSLVGLKLSTVDTHLFRIVEVIPDAPAAGTTYDRTHHDFGIVVTDNDFDGKLEVSTVKTIEHAEVTGPVDDNGDGKAEHYTVSAQFHNSEIVHSAKLTLGALKTFKMGTQDLSMADGQFEFALYQTGNTFDITGINPITAKNGAKGAIIFTTETYLFEAGTKVYYYVMKEQSTDGNGVITDKTVWNIRVTVEGLASGNAQVTRVEWRAAGSEAWNSWVPTADDTVFDNITFNNTYKAENAVLELFGNKNLTNLTPGVAEADRDMTASIKADDYRFELHPVGNRGMTLQKADGTVESGVAKLLSQVQAGGRIDLLGGSKLVYTEAGIYEYKVLEYQSNVPGATMDETEFTIKVQVVDNGNGQLVAIPTYWIGNQQVESVTFHNTYLAKPVTGITLSGLKVLSVDTGKYTRALKAGEFHFTLTRPDGSTETVSNAADGSITFSDLSFDRAGSYTYTITEYRAGTTYNGVAYDPNPKTITIVVADNGAGRLVAKVNDTQITDYDFGAFTNTYTATAATVQITGFKELAGRELKANEFQFTLSDATGVVDTKGNAADGTIAFEKLTFDKAGTYTYTVEELKLDDSGNPIQPNADGEYVYKGVTYTKLSYTVTVTITDNGHGQLISKVETVDNNGVKDPVEFLNTYKAESITVDIAGNTAVDGKTLTDGTSATDKTLADFAFKFQLLGADKNVLQVVTDNDAGFDFQDIEYTEAGTYTYYIEEVDGGAAGVTYDKSVYKVTVVIEDDLAGSLFVKELTYEKAENANDTTFEAADKITFANTYAAKETSVTFAGIKTLEGGRKLKGDDFSFILSDASGEIETVKNDAQGNFAFSTITYNKEGTWVYTLEEKNDGIENIEYDGTKYTLTVTVVDDNAQLKATVKIEKDQNEVDSYGFTNIYTPEDVKIHLDIQKILKNETSTVIGLDGFVFQLELDGVSTTKTSDAEGKARFELTFTAADIGKTFTYTLSEVKGSKPGITYDETTYTITVTINQNDDGVLVPTVQGIGTEPFTFTNTYTTKETSVTFAGTKTLEGGRKLKGDDFSFILSGADGVIETVKNNAQGSFVFSAITYTKEGTWVYTLEEKNDGVENVKYDGTKYTITVTVVDDNAQLKATVKIEKDQNEVDSYGFTNIYTPADIKVLVDVQKILDNKTTESIGLDGFQFQLDLDGVFATQTSDAEGKARFELTFTPADIGKTFTYTLTEVKGTKVGMTYDETVYTITVTITQNDDGELVPTVTGMDTGALTFTNVYEVNTDDENPKTGADTNGLMLALAFSAVCGLAVLVMGKKKFAE